MKWYYRRYEMRKIRRPPRGGRGLKFNALEARLRDLKSPPSRGAWIEMSNMIPKIPACSVAPLAGGVD